MYIYFLVINIEESEVKKIQIRQFYSYNVPNPSYLNCDYEVDGRNFTLLSVGNTETF